MSLIGFHRVLIGAAIVFCFGFAGWEAVTWWVTGAAGALILAVTFVVLGGLLTFYLSRLRSFVAYREEGEGSVARGGPGV